MNSVTSRESNFLLAEMTTTEVQELLDKSKQTVALIPLGSTEAHGPHLPLNTDTLISEAMAKQSAIELDEQGYAPVIFPSLCYARTEWARSFAGSVSLPEQTDTEAVMEIAKQAHQMGFDKIVLLNAHFEPEHVQLLRRVFIDFDSIATGKLVFPDPTRRKLAGRLTEEFQSGACHAGQYETSLILAIRPDLVRLDKMTTLPQVPISLSDAAISGAKSFAECGMDQAYCGSPSQASAQEGHQSLKSLVTFVLESIQGAQ